MRKYRPCVHKVSKYRLRESGEWQSNVLDWAGDNRLFIDVVALVKGEMDAVLRVLEEAAS